MPGNKIRRVTQIGNPTCLLGFSGRDNVDSAAFDVSTMQPGGVTEVQTLSITGTPTGGTIKLAFKGQTTANIAYNASAATVQTELRKLSRIGAVTCAGGALPGTPITITFTGKLANQGVPLITVASPALTGGTSPVASVARTTAGDPTFAGLYVIRSGLPLMINPADDSKVMEWDGASATTLVGIFDGQRELLGTDDDLPIPVYNHGCVFNIAVVKNYATYGANYRTWAAAHACQFKSQGT